MRLNRMFIYWTGPTPDSAAHPPPLLPKFGRHLHAPPCAAAPPPCPASVVIGLVPINFSRRIRSCQNSSDLIVQIDGGIAFPVVDLIRRSTAAYNSRARFPCEFWKRDPDPPLYANNLMSRIQPQATQGTRPNVPGAQPPQFPQSSQRPQQSAQQSGRHRFRPHGHLFKKKQGSSSSGSGSSSSSSIPRAIFYSQCGGKHPLTQCVGVQGACNNCGQFLVGVFRVKSGREVLRFRMNLIEMCFSFSAVCFVVKRRVSAALGESCSNLRSWFVRAVRQEEICWRKQISRVGQRER
ncbi:mediator of RNA polymerase II transcription subunit 16 [Dorcoceras hygrometricum]|uniref:Mediator of RNA polymerase II transcription subunit 16 n=1 Tax=Dorcoceras hygrometricum TaxID=472368 RepID=A0A2Z7C9Q1_9LAMI|nr:mediator of RNA polymerase II transcription subunit 16 [Dorcoceras hygrometricum]